MRLLQTVVEVAGEKNSTLVMPVPVELLRFFEKTAPGGAGAGLSPSLADCGEAGAAEADGSLSGAEPGAIAPVAGATALSRPKPGRASAPAPGCRSPRPWIAPIGCRPIC